ncbi:hypothetical protein MVEN_01816900 [Mycena venus]|uniref:Uncharacterized protein n=1 Tax=Mycena venus TaxID=2733690 RepID=A0A8H6XIS4_9AGAR|nr:hypothetical protein MVEN_01816900 [Mycena venus]
MEYNRQCMLDSTAFNVYWDDMVGGSTATGHYSYMARSFPLAHQNPDCSEGFYLNLSIVAIYTLVHRKKTAGKQILLAFTWAMTVLGTTQMVLQLTMAFLGRHLFLQNFQHGMGPDSPSAFQLSSSGSLNSLNLARNAIFVVNNLVTDSLFLYRCYMIWGSQWKVIVFPGFLIVSTFVVGCISVPSPTGQILQQAPYIMATITNLVLLFLAAGRIWWIRRDTRHVGTTALKGRYSQVIAMIVESGAIYCVFTILLIVTYPSGFPFAVLQAIAMHLVVSKAISSIQTCANVSYP